jgi:hypothetical protein
MWFLLLSCKPFEFFNNTEAATATATMEAHVFLVQQNNCEFHCCNERERHVLLAATAKTFSIFWWQDPEEAPALAAAFVLTTHWLSATIMQPHLLLAVVSHAIRIFYNMSKATATATMEAHVFLACAVSNCLCFQWLQQNNCEFHCCNKRERHVLLAATAKTFSIFWWQDPEEAPALAAAFVLTTRVLSGTSLDAHVILVVVMQTIRIF